MKLLTNLIFEPKGKHDPALAYTIKDTVMSADGSQVYFALQDVPENTPLTDEDYWKLQIDLSTTKADAEAATAAANTAAATANTAAANVKADVDRLSEEIGDMQDGGITSDMLSKSGDKVNKELQPIETLENVYIGGYTSDYVPSIGSGGTNVIKKVDVTKATSLDIPLGNATWGNNKITFAGYVSPTYPDCYLQGYTLENLNSKAWATIGETAIHIDFVTMKATEAIIKSNTTGGTWEDLQFAYVAMPNAAGIISGAIVVNTEASIDDFKWLREADDVDFVIPSKWIACTGMEYNFYKDNCLKGRSIDDVHLLDFVVSDGTRNTNWYQDKNRTIWIPRSDMVTPRKVTLYKYNNQKTVQKDINCISISPDSGSGKTRNGIVIGDSKVAGGRITSWLKSRCTEHGMTLNLYGGMYTWDTSNSHEGRSGWSAYTYTHMAERNGVANPFWNSDHFDFAYYMSTHTEYPTIDYVCINLGVNDVGDGYADTFVQNMNTMIDSIRAYDSSIKIIIGICEGQCTKEYSYSVLDFNYRARELNALCIAEWDSREAENLYICPLYLSMDMMEDFDLTEVDLSAIDAHFETGKKRQVVDDKTHQSKVGYCKNADYMFAVLQYIESII